jgi:hypothetical protein
MAKLRAKTKLHNANEKPRPVFVPRRGPVFLPEVFILESLSLKDEREHRLEGGALADMLRLSGKNPKYRYLHFSCHGDTNKICLRPFVTLASRSVRLRVLSCAFTRGWTPLQIHRVHGNRI